MSQVVRQENPLNTEPYSKDLASSFITPNELIFNRNHDSVISSDAPSASASGWTVSISLEDDEQLQTIKLNQSSTTLEELQRKHELVEITATLECAGNRLSELASSHQPAEGIQWGNAVIANVVWGGASLRSVLLTAGVPDPYIHHPRDKLSELEPSEAAMLTGAAEWARHLHLHLLSAQESSESDDPTRTEYFAASIPLPAAMHPNQGCLLAYQYNKQPLATKHGAPLRAVIPGHVGARWVKWLNGLRISTKENDSPPMRQDYKLLVPYKDSEQTYAEKASKDEEFRKEELRKEKRLQRLEASCSVTQPSHDGDTFDLNSNDTISIKGYAVGQDGSPASQVWVAIVPESSDDTSSEELLKSLPADVSWQQAKICHPQPQDLAHSGVASIGWSWAWSLWQADLPVPSAELRWAIVARCVTASSVEQEKISSWNLRGFCNRSRPVMRNLSVKHST
ncbi:hypothetical protein NDA13_001899 [Ustilago tritici]|nr:hypothetical protein NDA13_001899 [Ustilago tritici]